MIRDDLSNRLIHLMKGPYAEAENTFLRIVSDGVLLGSNSDIRGGDRVICFSEAPISKLGLILANPNAHNIRYRPFGVMFSKNYLFDKGARPVIYQPESEFDLINEQLRYRHVRYEPHNGIDWTWEREWRIKIDSLKLEPDEVTLIIPNRSVEEKMREAHHSKITMASRVIEFAPSLIGQFPWHFIVLEDLARVS